MHAIPEERPSSFASDVYNLLVRLTNRLSEKTSYQLGVSILQNLFRFHTISIPTSSSLSKLKREALRDTPGSKYDRDHINS